MCIWCSCGLPPSLCDIFNGQYKVCVGPGPWHTPGVSYNLSHTPSWQPCVGVTQSSHLHQELLSTWRLINSGAISPVNLPSDLSKCNLEWWLSGNCAQFTQGGEQHVSSRATCHALCRLDWARDTWHAGDNDTLMWQHLNFNEQVPRVPIHISSGSHAASWGPSWVEQSDE